MSPETGKWMIGLGLLIAMAGLLVYFFHDKLHWLGRLPGDVRIEREDFSFYFPITTMIILSVVVSMILYLVGRFMK